jgi:hypothetical protein
MLPTSLLALISIASGVALASPVAVNATSPELEARQIKGYTCGTTKHTLISVENAMGDGIRLRKALKTIAQGNGGTLSRPLIQSYSELIVRSQSFGPTSFEMARQTSPRLIHLLVPSSISMSSPSWRVAQTMPVETLVRTALCSQIATRPQARMSSAS